MLQITIPSVELWNDEKQEFTYTKERTLTLEHSLVSLSKWESKWHKPFLSTQNKTTEETIDYIRCMTITQNVDPEVYKYVTNQNMKDVDDYINDPMTATTFSNNGPERPSREIITAEIIYWWMISFNIPMECQKWHLNRLLTFIRVCGAKNQQPKKMGRQEIASRNARLNAARRKQLNTKG